MARAATTSDAFNAIAEPQRREILALLRDGERPVSELARDLGMSQPQASKHLRVLREVELRDEAVEKYHAIEGGEQTLRNLAAYVAELTWNETARNETTPKGAEG